MHPFNPVTRAEYARAANKLMCAFRSLSPERFNPVVTAEAGAKEAPRADTAAFGGAFGAAWLMLLARVARRVRGMVFMLLTLPLVVSALEPVRDRPSPRMAASGGDIFVTLGGGYYNGEDYEDVGGSRPQDAGDVAGEALHLSVNHASSVMLRVRGSWYVGYTSNTAEEVAGLIGFPLGADRRLWINAGVSRLTDVSDQKQSPIVGVPVELVFYPVRGLELMLHGNFNDDSNFVGIAIGGAMGRQRPR